MFDLKDIPRKSNDFYMNEALKEAKKALIFHDVPIGSVIVFDGRIISRAYNQVEKQNDPTAHAELLAIKKAIKRIGYKHLLNCQLYVTLEPCSMCAGAIVLSRIEKVIVGTMDPKSGACGSIVNIIQNSSLNHRCDLEFDVLQNECSMIIKDFFKNLRNGTIEK